MKLFNIPKNHFLLLVLLFYSITNAQTFVKFNAATAVILIPNVGIEVGLSNHYSFQLDALASFWDSFNGAPLQINQIFPEIRYYHQENLQGIFIGGHIGYGMFTLTKSSFPQFIEKGNYTKDNQMSGRNTYYGITLGYKKQLNQRWGYEIFIGGGTSQANYRGYSYVNGIRQDIPIDETRNFNKSGEWMPYRGGIMLIYKLNAAN